MNKQYTETMCILAKKNNSGNADNVQKDTDRNRKEMQSCIHAHTHKQQTIKYKNRMGRMGAAAAKNKIFQNKNTTKL